MGHLAESSKILLFLFSFVKFIYLWCKCYYGASKKNRQKQTENNKNNIKLSKPLSFRSQSSGLQSKSMGWFLYDGDLCHERVNKIFKGFKILTSIDTEWKKVPDFGSITSKTFFPKSNLIDFESIEIYFTVGSNYYVCFLKLKN